MVSLTVIYENLIFSWNLSISEFYFRHPTITDRQYTLFWGPYSIDSLHENRLQNARPCLICKHFWQIRKNRKKLVKYLSIWSFSRSDSSSLRKWLVLHYFSGNTICIRKRPFQKWLLKSTNHSRLALSRQKALSNAILIKHVTVKEISTIIPIMLDASQPFFIRFYHF